MEPPGGRDSRFQLGYSMNLLSGESPPEIYGGGLGRPSTSLQQLSPRHTMVSSACGTRGGLKTDVCYDERGLTPQHGMGFESSGVNDIHDESYSAMQAKKSPPSNGKKTKGRVKIKMEYIENKLRRYTTFSKRKTGIMKKAYELSTLTGTQVMLLVASETGHVYTFATRKLQPMITSEAGKALIQTCLNSPDPPVGSAGGDQRMSATGFEETELTYNISDEDSKEDLPGGDYSEMEEDDDDASEEEEEPPKKLHIQNNGVPQLSSSNNHSASQTPASTAPETKDKSSIISQIKQFNNALIQSNKAKISTPSASPPQSSKSTIRPSTQLQRVSPSAPLVITPQPPADSPKARPLVVKTPNGVAFASVSEGMILGITPESKYVIMPISSVANRGEIGVAPTTITAGNLSGAESSDSCSDDEMNGTDPEPLSVFVTPDHEVFSSISPPSSPVEVKPIPRQQSSPSATNSTASKSTTPNTSQAGVLGPLMYQTPQGMMYATPSNGGVLLSLAQGDANNKHQFITIPFSMMNEHGGGLEVTKKKTN